ncbi:MAG: WG repeat-containing protein [Bacteroidia bacterium]|nr:WG repeat-containing protein [Bacteroidia bacterium]
MNFLGWGGGAFFLIYAGLTAFVAYGAQSVSDALAALAYVCCGILLLPPGRKILEKVTGKSWSQRKLLRAYSLLASAGFVLTFLSMKTNAPEKSASSNPDAKPQNKATYLAAVKENFYWGYIGVDGQYVLKPAYDSATAFCGGVAKVVVGGRWKTIDSEGATTAESVGNCRQAPYSALYPRYDSVSGKYGYRDTNNAWVIAPKFDRAGTFQSTNP